MLDWMLDCLLRLLPSWFPGKKGRAARKEALRRAAAMRAEFELRQRVQAEVERGKPGEGGGKSKPCPVRRLVFRGRKILAPFGLLVVLWVAGRMADAGDVPPASAAVLWVLAAAGWWLLRGQRSLRRVRERRYAGGCVAGGAAWLVGAAVVGAGAVDFWLVAGWIAAALPWWQHHWPRDRGQEPETVVEGPAADSIVDRWEANVAAPNRALPGTHLYAPGVTEHGEVHKVQVVPGATGQQIDSILGKIPAIAQGLRTPMERIVIDQDPDTEDPSIFRLQVIHRSPIKQAVLFDQPRWRDGRLLLGPYADGIDEAVWRLYSDNSMWGGHLLGGTGSGKTRVLELIALTARAMAAARQPTTILYLDGQDGASSPTLWKHATWRGGPREANAFLAALDRGLAIRQKWNRLFGLAGFTPGVSPDGTEPGLPGVLTIIDEQHRIFTPQNALHWANIAREGRKVGMAIIAADQYCDLEAFGGKDALRSSLLAGNGLALRTASRSAGNLIPGLALDPSTFPELPGYGYKIAAAGSGERTAPFRARFLPDAKDRERIADLAVPIVEEWFARTADAPLDDMTARAFGEAFLNRHALAEAATQAARDEIEGRTPPPAPVVVADPVAAPTVVVEEESEEENGTTRDQILALLGKGGPYRPVELEGLTGKSKSSVKQALAGLLKAEQIDRGSDGYRLVREAVPAA